MINKKYIITLIVLLVILFGGYLVFNNDSRINSIIDNCNKLQGQVNMRIMPSCIIRGLKEQLNYTKQESYNYCMNSDYSRFCDEDIAQVYEN